MFTLSADIVHKNYKDQMLSSLIAFYYCVERDLWFFETQKEHKITRGHGWLYNVAVT